MFHVLHVKQIDHIKTTRQTLVDQNSKTSDLFPTKPRKRLLGRYQDKTNEPQRKNNQLS
jgi:hypothetical protein